MRKSLGRIKAASENEVEALVGIKKKVNEVKKRPLKIHTHVIGKVKKYFNKKGVIQQVVSEGNTSKFHVLSERIVL